MQDAVKEPAMIPKVPALAVCALLLAASAATAQNPPADPPATGSVMKPTSPASPVAVAPSPLPVAPTSPPAVVSPPVPVAPAPPSSPVTAQSGGVLPAPVPVVGQNPAASSTYGCNNQPTKEAVMKCLQGLKANGGSKL